MGLAALGGLGMLGCSGEAPGTSTQTAQPLVAALAPDRPALATPSLSDRRLGWTPRSDLELVDYLIAHDLQTVRMVEIELARGAAPEVRALASVIGDTRKDDLAVLMGSRAAISGSADVTDVPDDPHLDQVKHDMALTSGAELDRMFLVEMIGQDAASMGPLLRGQSSLLRAELQKLAQDRYDGQAAEIAALAIMLGDDPLTSVRGPLEVGLGPFGDARVPFTPENDVQLIDYYVSRHLEAIDLADMVLQYGTDPDVHAFALRMKMRMTKDLEILRAARFPLTGSAELPVPLQDPDTQTVLKAMKTMAGEPLDHVFVDAMLPHHADGTAPAPRALHQVVRGDVRRVVAGIFETQAKEIGELETLRKSFVAPTK